MAVIVHFFVLSKLVERNIFTGLNIIEELH